MWHEARKQERKIRGMLVDYRKRAERRQDFYEKIKADPTQFMQIHGRRCKIHLDQAVAAAGENPAIMMQWQGQADNLIDRFDVRAHLDYIPPVQKSKEPEELSVEERQCNYESYRILAQNEFLGITEEKYLQQLHFEEQFGIAQQIESEKPKKKTGGVAIGYTYDDDNNSNLGDSTSNPFNSNISNSNTASAQEDSDSDIDVDVSIDISKIETAQAHELNNCGRHYGMTSNDFYSFLTKDADEADALRMAREEEQEKIMLCGRKSRRERRAQREKRFAGRPISPPSYAAKEDPPTTLTEDKNDSESRSPSPENSGKITYITSFGGEDELVPHSKISINFNKALKGSTSQSNTLLSEITSKSSAVISGEPISYADKVKQNLDKLKEANDSRQRSRKPLAYQRRTRSRSRSYSHSRSRSRRSSYSSRRTHRSRNSRHRRDSRSISRRRRRSRDSRSRTKTRHRYRSSSSSRSSSVSLKTSKKRRRTSSSSSSSSSSNTSTSTSRSRSKSTPISKVKPVETVKKSPSVEKSKLSNNVVLEPTTSTSPIPPASIALPLPLALPPIVQSASFQPISELRNRIQEEEKIAEIQVPIKKYYGRKRDDQSSSDDEINLNELMEDNEKTNSDTSSSGVKKTNVGKQAAPIHIKSAHSSSSTSKSSFNPRDRLKKKMQILLNKQYKADKLAEFEKTERQIQQQQEREDEMRELALRLRRRQRELRHKYGTPSSHSDESDNNSDANSNNDSSTEKRREEKKNSRNGSRHRTKSRSPQRSRSRSRHKKEERRRKSRDRSSKDRNSRRREERTKRSRDRSSKERNGRRQRSSSRSNRRHSRTRRSNSRDRRSGSRSRKNDRSNHPRKLVNY